MITFAGTAYSVSKKAEEKYSGTLTAVAARLTLFTMTPYPTYTPPVLVDQLLPTLTPWPTYTPFVVPTSAPSVRLTDLGELVDPNSWTAEAMDRTTLLSKQGPVDISGEKVNAISWENAFLSSEQTGVGWSDPINAIQFTWRSPVQKVPLNGIIVQLYHEPSLPDREDKLFCQFNLLFEPEGSGEVFEYNSSEHYIAPNTWNTLAWDLTGVYYPEDSLWQAYSASTENEGRSYVHPASLISEKLLSDAMTSRNTDWARQVRSIGVFCYVSADEEYVGQVDQTEYRGRIMLGRAWALPANYPTLLKP